MPEKDRFQFFYKKIFGKAFLLLLLAVLFSSCTDQGCIDADDFGEYQTETLEVSANSSQASCEYNSSLGFSDSQGAGVMECLNTGTKSVSDENGVAYNSRTNSADGPIVGCDSLENAKAKNICANSCVESCMNNSGATGGAEPAWEETHKKSTSVNSGVTILPGAEIVIRAIGSVVLGDNIDYPPVYIRPNSPLPDATEPGSGAKVFFDVRANQSLNVKFSGIWSYNSGTTIVGAGTSAALGSDVGSNKAYNGGRRAVAYLIEHPVGYKFDTSALTEEEGSKSIPLLPDTKAWNCTYQGSAASDITQSVCTGTSYVTAGYTNVNDSAAGSQFHVTSLYKGEKLGTYGGMIRWVGDKIQSESYDPFASASCSSISGFSCNGTTGIAPTEGKMMPEPSGNTILIPNPGDEYHNSDTYEVSFKSLINNASCNRDIAVEIFDESSGATIKSFKAATNNAVKVDNNTWSSSNQSRPTHITLESKQHLVIQYNPPAAGGLDCDKVTAVRFLKYQDIEINRSGFVSFASLNGTGDCSIKGRIINPKGSFSTFTDVTSAAGFESDFYEYDDFTSTSSTDPMDSLTAPSTNSTQNSFSASKVFVRKGQIIRFAPASWNSSWSANSSSGPVNRQCGVGMAMKIDPRPALLCRGKASEYLPNPDCSPDYSTGALTGCSSTSSLCSTTGSSFCKNQCQVPIICSNGASPDYQKTCSIGNNTTPSNCYTANVDTATSCNICAIKMRDEAIKPARVLQGNIDQCYDLENYTGKVKNIPIATGFTDNQLQAATIAKGATKLGTFNGTYGNFADFSISKAINGTNETDAGNSNIIFKLASPITANNNGRLKFFMIPQASDFSSLYTDYAGNNGAETYNGSNGFKITTSGMLTFNNGEWMEVRLCKESDTPSGTSTTICSGLNPVKLADGGAEYNVVDIQTPTSGTTPPIITSSYSFDSYGNLTKTGTPDATTDCGETNSGTNTLVGSLFYCHTYKYYAPAALKALDSSTQTAIATEIAKLRLTFKILDPENTNCIIPQDPSLPTGVSGIKIKNPHYTPNRAASGSLLAISGMDGAECSYSESPSDPAPSGKTKCTKEFYCASKYTNNSGHYNVIVKVKNPAGTTVSNVISGVITPIVTVMDGTKDGSKMGQTERIYKLLVGDPRYNAILTMCIVMMYTFYGLGFLLGVSELNSSELINRVIKIGLIYLFVGETGWQWFHDIIVKFFKNGTDYLAFVMASAFDDSAGLREAIANSDFYDKSILFGSVDNVFGLFFSDAVQKKISALLFASIFGWAYLLIIYNGFLLYIYAVANAVLLYLTAQVFTSLLFTLGPIFFIFTLFNQTKEMFDSWLKQLIGFSLQQIFLLTTLAFFNLLMYEVIKLSLGYKICWDDVWTINIIVRITLLSFWTVASLPPRTDSTTNVGNIGHPDGIPSLFSILFIWVIASLMQQFITFMTNVAAMIGGGLKASDLGSGIADAAKSLQSMAKNNPISNYISKQASELSARVDDKLFDSGKNAKKRREETKAKNSKDISDKSAMSKAGDAAMSDYKKKHGSKLAGMSQEEQKTTLMAERKKGMDNKGAELGLSKAEIEKLQNQSGPILQGSNAFSAAANLLKQAVVTGGSLRNSLDAKSFDAADTKFTRDEAKGAMANMNKEERKKFIAAAKKGDVRIEDTSTAKAVAKGVASLGIVPLVKGIKALHNYAKQGSADTDSYNQAQQELEKEGAITKMAAGSGWTRSDAEKKDIRKRQQELASRKTVNTKANTASAIADLDTENRILSGDSSVAANLEELGMRANDFVGERGEKYKAGMDKTLQSGKIDEAREKSSTALKAADKAAIDLLKGKSGNNTAFGDQVDELAKLRTNYDGEQNAIKRAGLVQEMKTIQENPQFIESSSEFESRIAAAHEQVSKMADLQEAKANLNPDSNEKSVIRSEALYGEGDSAMATINATRKITSS